MRRTGSESGAGMLPWNRRSSTISLRDIPNLLISNEPQLGRHLKEEIDTSSLGLGAQVIEKIEPIPKIPEPLRLAAFQRKLIPFIGAGVSQLGGCPGWDQFANAALQFFLGKGKLS